MTQDPSHHCLNILINAGNPEAVLSSGLVAEDFATREEQKLFECIFQRAADAEAFGVSSLEVDPSLGDESKKLARNVASRHADASALPDLIKYLKAERARVVLSGVLVEAAKSINDGGDPVEIARSVIPSVLDVEQGGSTSKLMDGGDTSSLFNEVEWRAVNPGKIKGLSTGFRRLDNAIDGLQPVSMVFAAPSSGGKSSLAANICANVCRDQMKIENEDDRAWPLYISCEDSGVAIQKKMLSAESGVSISESVYSNQDMSNLSRGFAKIKKWKWKYSESVFDIDDVVIEAQRMRYDRKISLIILDYLQLMGCRRLGSRADSNDVGKEIMAVISEKLVKDLNVPVISLAQFTKSAVKQAYCQSSEDMIPAPPNLGDIYGSAAFGQAARVVLFTTWSGGDKINESDAVFWTVKKNYQGPEATIPVSFIGSTQQFIEK